MEIGVQALFLAAGFFLLLKGADWFVDGAAGIAAKFKIPQLVIGLTVVAMGTSAPEAAVSISSALKGSADITIGNIVGSNILNILIILGLSAVITPLAMNRSTLCYEIPFLFAITALLLTQGMDGTICFTDGVIQIICFVLYIVYLLIMTKKHPNKEIEMPDQRKVWQYVFLALIGLALILFGSDVSVDAATTIAEKIGISERFIGLTIVALGTSLPELFTSVSAAKKGNADIAIGNIVGSNIFNILFVVGLSSVIVPVPFASSFRFDIMAAGISTLLLFLFCRKDRKLKRWHGVALLMGYIGYFAMIL
ncbi:calcium/sodium antiporter [Hominifimenecus sp. rT4P-3]|uniref:calcium/sodium antiporter n=1 Tax=Hominifimenecus sp. rT4P-3 TaxID=3242979 RepID=UPI003DA536F3